MVEDSGDQSVGRLADVADLELLIGELFLVLFLLFLPALLRSVELFFRLLGVGLFLFLRLALRGVVVPLYEFEEDVTRRRDVFKLAAR